MTTKALSGGDKLTSILEQLSKNVEKGAQVRMGFLEGSTDSVTGTPEASIAVFQEFGTVNTKSKTVIPPRPFFRPLIAEQSNAWGKELGDTLKGVNYDAARALALMGELMGGQLQEAIINVSEPALSPITLMLRQMRREDQTLGSPSNPIGGKTIAEAARRVAAGESVDASTKPLIDKGDMIRAVGYQVDSGEKHLVNENIQGTR